MSDSNINPSAICLIIPFFGEKPDYYDMWEKSAIRNTIADFLIITDIMAITSNQNIKVIHESLNSFRERVQSKIGFQVALGRAYKCCDFRPAYGKIFEKEIEGYLFWGYCDMDLLWGDMSKFITSEKIANYDKIYEHGHLCLYKNTDFYRNLFYEEGPYPEPSFREVFTSEESWGFDEYCGMTLKCRRMKVKTYANRRDFFDCRVENKVFVDALAYTPDAVSKPYVIKYDNGRLYAMCLNENVIEEREILYFHFQKRKLKNLEGATKDRFYITPNEIVAINISKQELLGYLTEKDDAKYGRVIRFRARKKKLQSHFKRYRMEKKSKEGYSLFQYIEERKQASNRFKEIGELLKKYY